MNGEHFLNIVEAKTKPYFNDLSE